MRELTTCHHCQRYIATDFTFCPYCGHKRAKNYEFRNLLETPFDRMERSVQEYSLQRLEMIERQLQLLEVDLQHLIDRTSASRS